MSKARRFAALFASLASFAAACFSGWAMAVPPLTENMPVSATNDLVASCGDFDILANGIGTLRVTTFFSTSGDPIRFEAHGLYRGTLTNSVTGETLGDDPSVINIRVDLVNGTETRAGAWFNITVPGVGNVYFEAGRLIFEGNGPPVFVAGQQHAPPETVALLCAALE